jgi:hypothetical protein
MIKVNIYVTGTAVKKLLISSKITHLTTGNFVGLSGAWSSHETIES